MDRNSSVIAVAQSPAAAARAATSRSSAELRSSSSPKMPPATLLRRFSRGRPNTRIATRTAAITSTITTPRPKAGGPWTPPSWNPPSQFRMASMIWSQSVGARGLVLRLGQLLDHPVLALRLVGDHRHRRRGAASRPGRAGGRGACSPPRIR